MRKWIILAFVFGSFSAIGASQAFPWNSSPLIGSDSPGRRDRSASNIRELGGDLLKSGLQLQRKENDSYALLAQRRALIQIKLVNGKLAAVVLPDTECPAP